MERKTTSPTAKRAVAAAFAGALALSFGGLTVVPNDAASQLLAAAPSAAERSTDPVTAPGSPPATAVNAS
ncbi:hypothetical protein, partial [Mycolicibacterium flavescens]|uniref:hypothetical protein n=1 Tax=Mycolicibacterium flavescens TaxID=1776 RepID=UPI001041C64D